MEWNEFEYVKDYFRSKFPEYYLLEARNENFESSKIRKIVYDVFEKELSKYSHEEIISVEVQGIIYEAIDKHLNSYFSESQRDECKNLFAYVCNDRFTSKYNSKCSDSILRGIAGQIVSILYGKNKSSIELDERIITYYEEIYNDLYKKVEGYISNTLTNYFDYYKLIKVNQKELVLDVTDAVMFNGSYSFLSDMVNSTRKFGSQVRNKIINYIERYIFKHYDKKENEEKNVSRANLETQKYIFNYLSIQFKNQLSEDDLTRCSCFIDSYLVGEKKHNPEDIISRKLDSSIEHLCYTWIRSCQIEKVPESIEYKPKISKMQKTVFSLLLAGVIFTFNSVYAIGSFANHVENEHNEKTVVQIMSNDGFGEKISAVYSYDYSAAAKKVLSLYSEKYQQYGDRKYDYIPFDEAYMNIDSDYRLVVMDKLMKEVVDLAFKDGKHLDFAASLVGNSCYLEFMYNDLESMGFEEIRDEKYQELLRAYLNDREKYPNDASYFSRLSTGHVELLNQVESKYVELCKKKLLEVEKMPINEESILINKDSSTQSHGGRI